MSHVDADFEVPLSGEVLAERLQSLGWRVSAEGHAIRARQGSQFRTRLLGGWFINETALPKELLATQQEDTYAVSVSNAMGPVVFDSKFTARYEAAFAALRSDLTSRG